MTVGGLFIIALIITWAANASSVYDKTHKLFDVYGANDTREFLTYALNIVFTVLIVSGVIIFVVINWNHPL
jgi:heme/copper-type cytochrome/quinol oxidase subunit 2